MTLEEIKQKYEGRICLGAKGRKYLIQSIDESIDEFSVEIAYRDIEAKENYFENVPIAIVIQVKLDPIEYLKQRKKELNAR